MARDREARLGAVGGGWIAALAGVVLAVGVRAVLATRAGRRAVPAPAAPALAGLAGLGGALAIGAAVRAGGRALARWRGGPGGVLRDDRAHRAGRDRPAGALYATAEQVGAVTVVREGTVEAPRDVVRRDRPGPGEPLHR